ncbi:hypothetical protein AMTRI_Chr11g96360 [Amborella trichopoda]
MGVDLDIPIRVVFDAIRANVKKVRAKVKVATSISTNAHEEVKDKSLASNSVTSKGKEPKSKLVRWSAHVAVRSVPRTACKPFSGKVLNLSGDDDDFQGPSAQFYTDGSLVAANEGCSSFSVIILS